MNLEDMMAASRNANTTRDARISGFYDRMLTEARGEIRAAISEVEALRDRGVFGTEPAIRRLSDLHTDLCKVSDYV
jgi:hypothetical protein